MAIKGNFSRKFSDAYKNVLGCLKLVQSFANVPSDDQCLTKAGMFVGCSLF